MLQNLKQKQKAVGCINLSELVCSRCGTKENVKCHIYGQYDDEKHYCYNCYKKVVKGDKNGAG